MKVLLANDDGIFAPGIIHLLESFREISDFVYVTAPDRERSATGHSITVHRPLRIRTAPGLGDKAKGWIVDGTPADCVKLALESLIDEKPDLMIAGINDGPNLGSDVLYSGTVSAAMEGLINGIPALSVSLATWEEADYEYAAQFVRNLAPLLLQHPLPPGTLLNVNVPPGTVKGVRFTRLCTLCYTDAIHRRTDPRGREYFWMAGQPESPDVEDDGTDIGAVHQGYVSITPLQIDLTNYQMIEELKKWPIKV
ncbi:MAG: 5'/3'-nucleotidase SurE [Eubacteriales bacterium]|nr:5'/3'-nucleotidase SurE [Eubacteriales bacterium]MDZ4042462.1 5'/3'-nucleotidase SurE [Eubacteriales bacterium]MDZ7610570.1 5'/3'-nucleotidase SurE [Eubacteriales bacterium]